MQPTLLLRLEHALVPGRDAAVASAIAEIMGRPCFAPLKRMSLETYSGRNMRYTKPSAEAIQAYLCDPLCDVVDLDSGRQGELIAAARLPTGLLTRPQSWAAYPAPLELYIIVPHDPSIARARIDAFCDLAGTVQAAAGCVSMELGFDLAQGVTIANLHLSPELQAMQPGLTVRPMPISELFRRMKKYQDAAGSKERIEDYLNHQDDSRYEMRVVYEMFMDLLQRVENIEKLLDVSPDE